MRNTPHVSARRRWQGIAGGVLAGLAISAIVANATLADDRTELADDPDIQHAVGLSNAFKKIAGKIAPAVVHITSVDRIDADELSSNRNGMRMPDEDLLRRFFGDRFGELGIPDMQGMTPQIPRERRGTGSGVIVRDDGVILTNNHVIANADDVVVRLSDGREYDAVVLGTDAESDLAVIRIDAGVVPAATLGDSESVEAGEWVLAVGNPFGLDQTVTSGIISASGRTGLGLATFENFLQTDAAINPGNSGGPLVNLYGEVIGINTAINTRTGGSDGVGFAIPSRMARDVLDSILETGRVERGWLGVYVQPLDMDLAASFGLETASGALISNVVEDGPAQDAGLQVGDIVTAVNGATVVTPNDLITNVSESAPGEIAQLEVLRDGRSVEIELELGERPGAQRLVSAEREREPRTDHARSVGVVVQGLTPQIAEQLNYEGNGGVVVSEVRPGSPAAAVGLRRGDVIARVGNVSVDDVDDFEAAMENVDLSDGVRMLVTRGGANRFVFIKG